MRCEKREILVSNDIKSYHERLILFVNGLKLAEDAFAVSANASVDGKKASGITLHTNIRTHSCVHVARVTLCIR